MRYPMLVIISVLCGMVLQLPLLAWSEGAIWSRAEGLDTSRIRIPHAPISITSDADFASQAASDSWPGNGASADPYIISSLEINGSGYKYGLSILGTTVHFVIMDCLIMDVNEHVSYSSGTGIWLDEVQNGLVEGCIIERCDKTGISVQGSDAMIEGCTVADNQKGAYLEEVIGSLRNCTFRDNMGYGAEISKTEGLRVEDNLMDGNGDAGIYIGEDSHDNEFHRNVFLNCSFDFANDKEVFTTNHIPVDNLVNGLPVYQIKDHAGAGEEISLKGGQLILGNVSDIVISKVNISRASLAIVIGFCTNVTARDCNLLENDMGIGIVGGDNITVQSCRFEGGVEANIAVYGTMDATVINCSAYGGEVGLLGLNGATRTKIHDNHFSECMGGIILVDASGAEVHGNTMIDCTHIGIELDEIFGSTIEGNRIVCEGVGINSGIGLGASAVYGTEIRDNFIKDAKQGAYITWGFDLVFINNTIDSSMKEGVLIDGSDNCLVRGNLFFRSGGLGLSFVSDEGPTMDDLILGNSFLFNNGTTNIHEAGRYQAGCGQSWGNSTNVTEWNDNHWSDWTTPDDDGDGTVDAPYPVEGGFTDTGPLVLDPLLHATPPTEVRATVSSDAVEISWSGPAFTRSGQISGYRVYRAQGEGPSLFLEELTSEARHYIDNEVESGRFHSYSVRAYNLYGMGMMSGTVGGTPDSDPPELTLTGPLEGSFWNVTSVWVTWESSDNIGVTGHRYRMDRGDWTEAGLNTSVLLSDLSEGDHSLEVVCYDDLGNHAHGNVTFRIDLTGPQVEIIEPAENLITSSTSILVEWVGEDLPYSVKGYEWRLDKGVWTATGVTTVRIEGLTDGAHNIEVKAIDMAGNVGHTSVSFMVDTASPIVEILTPTEGEEIMGRPIGATWSANGTGTPIGGVRTKIDSGPWRELGLAWNETLMGLGVGNHTYWVSATDLAGNTGTSSVSFRVVIEIPEPPGPGKGLVMGRVLDDEGDPVHKVKVIADTGEETYTDSEGYFFLEVQAGRRTITFTKNGYETYDRIIEAGENQTSDMGSITIQSTPPEREGWEWWHYCLCCLSPFVLIILLFILIGAVARIRRRRSRRVDAEE